MPLPTTLYIRKNTSNKLQIITGVTDWKKGTWLECRDTYRDGDWETGEAQILATGTPSSQIATVPVTGTDGGTPGNSTYTTLRFALPDPVAHVAPRPKWTTETGYIIALNNGVIPTPTIPGLTGTFTTDSSLETFTLGSHGFAHGDKVTAGTAVAGLSTSDLYTVLYISTSVIKLLTSAGAVHNVSANTTVTLTLVQAAPLNLFGLSGIITIRDGEEPSISTTHPDT